jgi:hypothetical protein
LRRTLAGDELVFKLTATNAGNIELLSVTITSDIGTLTCAAGNGVTLQPGASLACTATYVVTQEDLDRGTVTDAATATAGLAEWTGIILVSQSDSETAAADQKPALNFDFTANDTLLTSPGAIAPHC